MVGGLGRCLDVVGAIGASLDNGLTAIEAAVVLTGEVALEPLDRYDIFDLHKELKNQNLKLKMGFPNGIRDNGQNIQTQR